MIEALVTKLLLTTSGAALVIALITRLIPNDKLDKICYGAGVALSAIGCKKLGIAFWESIESFMENSIGVCISGFLRGLNADDKK